MKPAAKARLGDIILPGAPEITVLVATSAAAKRLSLRISRLKHQAKLTVPPYATQNEAERFVREKEAWIRKHLAAAPAPSQISVGTTILFEGDKLVITQGSGRRVVVAGNAMHVPGAPDMVAARVKAFLKLRAKVELTKATEFYAAALGQRFGRITLRDTTSRWGSCSSQRNINYSWRLIMAPPAVLQYVTAHEVAHLIEMNHSPAYWAQVARVYPDYAAPRTWLRQNGERLHRYQFS